MTATRPDKVRLAERLGRIPETWMPHRVASVDGHEVKLVRIQGEFVWHSHEDADELFLVVDGRFRMEFRDHAVDVAAGELIVVPKGVEHRPVAEQECAILLFERAGVVNTGDAAPGALTRAATPEL